MSETFDLSVSFSRYNGAVVLESTENSVKIGLREITDEELKKKLLNSVKSYFGMKGKIVEDDACSFVQIDEATLTHEISLRYAQSSRENERKNEGSEAELLLDTLLRESAKSGATDIHIEEHRVRFRVYGRLEQVCELSSEKSRELVRRIKVLANLNVIECRHGQDGQFVFQGDDEIFVRVSCIPQVSKNPSNESSESVVLRLLNVSRVPLSIEELGFSANQCESLRKMIAKEQGLILICGSTGSGKSTTAASLLSELNERSHEHKKIITIEDPPEYVLDGITQIHVDETNGMSFSDSLRYIFRQDPDVIFVGEIRDSLTARTVLQASLTGHLVFATVHTGSLAETAIRMKELGVDFAEFSSVLNGIVFQKLVFDSEIKNKIQLSAHTVAREEREFAEIFENGLSVRGKVPFMPFAPRGSKKDSGRLRAANGVGV
ncbi:MAG: Flp pilus assembly complex ATPase component TadA [Treponema sp.]|nr:Flp pilus assembly complex ATPase component TadA [Treponema sp.]